MTSHDETLILELLGDIAGAGARHLNPSLGEDGASSEHVGNVDSSVDGVQESVLEVQGRRHVVDETRDGGKLGGALLGLPDTKELNQQVLREARVEHLADQEDVGGQGRLQHDGHVGGVEQTDGVGATGTTLAVGLDGDLDAEALEVDDGSEDGESGEQVHDVGEVLAVESLLESTLLVGPGHEQVEEGNDGTLELGTTSSVDGGRGESLPHDGLADVSGNEQGNTAAQAVALLEKLIEKNDNHAGNNELQNEEEDDTSTEVAGRAVETAEDVDGGSTGGEDEGEELLGSLVELTVGLEVEVDVDHVGTGEKLEDHARGDDGRDTKLHKRTTVTGHHHAQPVERVRGVGGDNAVKGHLAHDQEDEQCKTSPHQLLVEGDLGLGLLHLWQKGHEWLDEVEESYCKQEQSVSMMVSRVSMAGKSTPERVAKLIACSPSFAGNCRAGCDAQRPRCGIVCRWCWGQIGGTYSST